MRRTTFASFSERNYALFYAGQVLSLTGSWLEKPALNSIAWDLTHQDKRWIGWMAIISLGPTLLVSIPAGSFADRHDPRRIVVWTQSLMMLGAAAMAAIVFFGHCTIWHVAAYTAYSSGVFAADAAARQSLLVQLVPRERLLNAVALNASMFSVARFAGGALYAGLNRWTELGDAGCLALNAVSFGFVLGGLLLMRLPARAPEASRERHDMLEGVRYAWRTPEVRATLLLISLLSMFGFQISYLFVVYADQVWDAGRPGLGEMHAAAGLGAFAGSLFLATRASSVHRGSLMFRYACAAALLVAAFAVTPWFAAALAVLAIGSFVMTQGQSAGNSLLQHTVPDRLRGRVMSLYTLAVLASFPIGGFFAGFASDAVGAPATTLLDAAVILVAVLAIALTHPTLKKTQ